MDEVGTFIRRCGKLPFANHMKIDNAHFFATATAAQTKARFDL